MPHILCPVQIRTWRRPHHHRGQSKIAQSMPNSRRSLHSEDSHLLRHQTHPSNDRCHTWGHRNRSHQIWRRHDLHWCCLRQWWLCHLSRWRTRRFCSLQFHRLASPERWLPTSSDAGFANHWQAWVSTSYWQWCSRHRSRQDHPPSDWVGQAAYSHLQPIQRHTQNMPFACRQRRPSGGPVSWGELEPEKKRCTGRIGCVHLGHLPPSFLPFVYYGA